MRGTVISLRVSPVLAARVEELAEARGSTKAAAIRAAIIEASTPEDAPVVPDEREILVLLGESARGGSVPAIRELLDYHRKRRRTPPNGDPLAALDELAAQRQATGGGGPPNPGQTQPASCAARLPRNAETSVFRGSK